MKYTRILSIAVVAMFAFAALAVVVNSDSSDADTTDYSGAAYVKLEKISQADFETLYGDDTYSLISDNMKTITGVFFSSSQIWNNSVKTVTYKDITYISSKANTLNGTSYESISAIDIEITDLVIKLKFTSDLSEYYYAGWSSDNSLLDVCKYLGTEDIKKDSEMILTFSSFSYSKSLDSKKEYSAVPETSNYVNAKIISATSESLSSSVDVTLRDKKITIDYDNTDAYTNETKYDYVDNAKYAIGSIYNSGIKYNADGSLEKIIIKADGKEYVHTDVDSSYYTKEYVELINDDNNYIRYVSAGTYSTLPTDEKYTYNSVLPGVSSDNDTAKGQIEAKGGSCDTSVDSAKNLCSDCYNGSKTSFKTENNGSNTGLIVALVIVAVIAVILAVVLIVKISKDKTKKV